MKNLTSTLLLFLFFFVTNECMMDSFVWTAMKIYSFVAVQWLEREQTFSTAVKQIVVEVYYETHFHCSSRLCTVGQVIAVVMVGTDFSRLGCRCSFYSREQQMPSALWVLAWVVLQYSIAQNCTYEREIFMLSCH